MMRSTFVAVLGLGITGSAVAAELAVPGDYSTIQAAIDAAANGDVVSVSPGTYQELVDLSGKAITLRKAPGEGHAIIDANGWWASTVSCVSGEGPDTIIDGFWIKGGRGTMWGPSRYGGGMYIFNTSPTVRNCTFSSNSADGGGGLCTVFGSPTIEHCVFAGNTASIAEGGGGMYNHSSTPKIVNCEFINNSSVAGGGMTNLNAMPQIVNCLFRHNIAAFGAGMRNENASPTLTNCTFAENAASSSGGGMKSTSNFARPVIRNSVFWGNSAPFGPEILDQTGAASTVDYSTVDGGWDGAGADNDPADPMFVDADAGNLRLLPASPCIDEGSSDAMLYEMLDLDGNDRVVGIAVDKGVYECQEDSAAPCLADLDGSDDVGFNDLMLLLGAWGPCAENCPSDLDGTGATDFGDLVALFSTWGPCP